jgi:hypothetical protein
MNLYKFYIYIYIYKCDLEPKICVYDYTILEAKLNIPPIRTRTTFQRQGGTDGKLNQMSVTDMNETRDYSHALVSIHGIMSTDMSSAVLKVTKPTPKSPTFHHIKLKTKMFTRVNYLPGFKRN